MQPATRSLSTLLHELGDLPCAHLMIDEETVKVPVTHPMWQRVASMLGTPPCAGLPQFLGQLSEAGASIEQEDGMRIAVLSGQVLRKIVTGLTLL